MSNEKYLLLKGRGGMGNRILSLIGSILYAQITHRKLIVDWSDEAYSYNRSNIFPNLFTLQYVNQVTKIPETDSVFPHIWRGNLDKSFEDIMRMYNISGENWVVSTPLIGTKYSVNIARRNLKEDLLVRWSYFAEINKLRRAFKGEFETLRNLDDKTILRKLLKTHLFLKDDIQTRIDIFKKEYFHNKIIIGVHIRYTDRKNPFEIYPEIIDKIIHLHPKAMIFLATDNRLIQTSFKDMYGEIVLVTNKWFPSETSRLHFNPNCPNQLETVIQALVDMYILSSCTYLICDQRSTFSVIAELLSDIPKTNVIDTSPNNFRKNMRRFISFLERWL